EPVGGVQRGWCPLTSGDAGSARELGVDLSAAAAAALDDDRDEVRLLHRPHALDELRDGNAVRVVDTKEDEALGKIFSQLGAVVEVQLLERVQDVVETAQAGPPLLVVP